MHVHTALVCYMYWIGPVLHVLDWCDVRTGLHAALPPL